MIRRTLSHFLGAIGVAIGLALMAVGTVQAVLAWIPYETANLSRSGEARHVGLAVSATGSRAAAWWVNVPTGERRGDLILANAGPSGWVTETLTTTLEARWPSPIFSGTYGLLAWFQGQLYTQPATAMGGWVWERDDQAHPRRVTETLLYTIDGVRPRWRVGNDGLHMTFAAALTSTMAARGDLYYLYRPFTATTWASTVVVTRDQAIVAGAAGGVFYPDLAIGDGVIHLVWEQKYEIGGRISYTIDYISATLGAGGQATWAAPVPLSSPETNGQRPAIALDGAGRVHVVWTHYITDTEQYVQYRRLDESGWSQVQVLNGEPLRVNKIRPTVVWPAVAAGGNQVCVAWHGFYPDAPYEAEEIYLRCSQDGGDHWGPMMNVSRSPSQLSLMPAVAIGADGAVHIAWEEFQGGESYFYNYDALYAAGPPEVYPVFLPLVLRNG